MPNVEKWKDFVHFDELATSSCGKDDLNEEDESDNKVEEVFPGVLTKQSAQRLYRHDQLLFLHSETGATHFNLLASVLHPRLKHLTISIRIDGGWNGCNVGERSVRGQCDRYNVCLFWSINCLDVHNRIGTTSLRSDAAELFGEERTVLEFICEDIKPE